MNLYQKLKQNKNRHKLLMIMMIVAMMSTHFSPLAQMLANENQSITSIYDDPDVVEDNSLDEYLQEETPQTELEYEAEGIDDMSDDPSSYVTQADSGDLAEDEAIELIENMTDDPIFDPLIEGHIKENYNSSLVTYNEEEMRLIGALPVRSTIFNETTLGRYRTLEQLALNDDVWFDSFLSMFVTTVPLYELSENSDYFVAFADTMFHDSNMRILDYVFAISNLDGEVVQGRFDASTGMAYVPRSLLVDEATDTLYIGEIQLQLMQVQRSDNADIYSTVTTLVDEDLTTGVATKDDYVHDVMTAPANAFETTLVVATGLHSNDMTVFINGFEHSDFEYDSSTGHVTIPVDSASILSLRVETDDDELNTQIHEEVAQLISTLDFQTIQPQASNINIADVTLSPSFASSGVMTSDIDFRYFHGGNNPWNNYGHLAWYGPDLSHAQDLVNGILNGGVNFDDLQVSSLTPTLMPLVLNIGTGANSPFNSISNIDYRFTGDRHNGPAAYANGISLVLACATIGVPLASMGETTTIVPGVESRGTIQTRARIIRQESNRVFIGFVTGNTYGGAEGQAGYGVLSFGIEPQDGYARVQKQSAGEASYVNNNPLFSLAGAQYWVFDNQNDAARVFNAVHSGQSVGSIATTGRVGVLTTNASGLSNSLSLSADNYWAVETVASLGHALSTGPGGVGTFYTLTVRPNETTTFTSIQPVPSDPTFMRLQKRDYDTELPTPQGDASLAGVRYTVKWFPGHQNNPNSNNAVRTWVFETNAQGLIMFRQDSFLISSLSDPVWRDNEGGIRWPLGTITVQETRAPSGHLIDPTVYVGFISQHSTRPEASEFRWSDGSTGGLMVYREGMIHENKAIRGGEPFIYISLV